MAQPRYSQISMEETPWYHVVSRCVRRAYLCGVDQITGQNFEHRREWVEKRILQLASVFTINNYGTGIKLLQLSAVNQI